MQIVMILNTSYRDGSTLAEHCEVTTSIGLPASRQKSYEPSRISTCRGQFNELR